MGSDRRRCERMMGASIFIKTFGYLIENLPSFYVSGTFWSGGSNDQTELLFFFRGLRFQCQCSITLLSMTDLLSLLQQRKTSTGNTNDGGRSAERRVGKECIGACRCRGSR